MSKKIQNIYMIIVIRHILNKTKINVKQIVLLNSKLSGIYKTKVQNFETNLDLLS